MGRHEMDGDFFVTVDPKIWERLKKEEKKAFPITT
jgi:hypothetical protein